MTTTQVSHVRVTTTVELLDTDHAVLAQAMTSKRSVVGVWKANNLTEAARTTLGTIQEVGERANVGAFAALTGGKES